MVWRIQFHSLEGILNSRKIFPFFIVGSAKEGKEAQKNHEAFLCNIFSVFDQNSPFSSNPKKKVFLDAISVLGSFPFFCRRNKS